jgi:hypothetical protein
LDSEPYSYDEIGLTPPRIAVPCFDGFPENIGLLDVGGGVRADPIFGVCMYMEPASCLEADARALALDGFIGAAGGDTGGIDLGVSIPFFFIEAETP